MKQKTNIITKAGVLLVAVVMVLSALPAVTAESRDSQIGEMARSLEGTPELIGYFMDDSTTLDGLDSFAVGAEGDLIYEHSISYLGDNAFTSSYNPGPYYTADNFIGLTESIGGMSITGLCLFWTGTGWTAGDPAGMTFSVEFHDEVPPAQPDWGNPVTSFSGLVPTSYSTVGTFAGFNVYEWFFDFPSDVSMSDGYWVLFNDAGDSLLVVCNTDPIGDDVAWQNTGTAVNPVQTAGTVENCDLTFKLFAGGGGPGPGPGPGECLEDQCDFAIFGFSDEFNAMSTYDDVLDAYYWNSLPKTLEINITNNGEIGISEVKILADIFEKVCGPTTGDCIPKYDLQAFYDKLKADGYWSTNPFEFEGWESWDDLDDDSWVLQGGPDNRWLTDNQAWRCTLGEDRSGGGDLDIYLGKNDNPAANGLTDDLITPGYDISGAACASFSFSHWCEGEYTFDDDGFVVPVDYGTIEYSVNGGVNWTKISIGDFVAYDTGDEWVPVNVKFINTAIDAGDEGYMHPYATICDDCAPEEGDILIEVDFPVDAELQMKFAWHKDPCCQWEGWYIDDVCFTRTEDYQLVKVWQGHIITDLDGCIETPDFIDFDFPLDWDPEPDTWYEIWIHGQVFSPMGCELDTLNNWFKTQFKIVDIHDMACIGMNLVTPEDGTTTPGSAVTVNMTVQNLGTFTESNVPIDLLVGDMVVDQVLNNDFETDPTGMTRYNFNRGNGITHFHLTTGDPSISDIYTNDPIQARSLKPGNEAYICAEEGSFPFMIEDTMAYLEIDEVIDLDLNDNGVVDYGDPVTADLSYFYKYSMEPSGSAVAISVSLLEGPGDVTSYITWDYIDGTIAAPYYSNDWVLDEINLLDLIQGTVSYWETQGYDFTGYPIPAANVGWIVFGAGPNVPWPGGAVNGGVVNPTNPIPWSGFMMDRLRLDIVSIDESTLEKVSGTTTGSIAPMATETVELTWSPAELCFHALVGDVNADDDLVPSNDKCFETVKVLDEEKCFDGGSVDLTDAGDCLWHLCNNRPGGDDMFAWTGIEEENWCHYVNNMDESLVSPTINVSGFEDEGVAVNFTHYVKFAEGDFGEVYVQSGGAWHKLAKFMAPTGPGFAPASVFVPEEYCQGGFFKIKFRFVSNDEGVSEGWFIDDIHIVDVTDDGMDASLAAWDLQFNYDVETPAGTQAIAGAGSDGTYLYGPEWSANAIHKYDLADGTYLGSFTISGVSGLRDLAYDPNTGYFYGGAASGTIWVMDFDTQTVVDTLTGTFQARAITYNPDDDVLYCSNWNDPIYVVNPANGNTITTISPGLDGCYGMAYDFDGINKYLYTHEQGGGSLIWQLDLGTEAWTGFYYDVAADLDPTAIAGGLFITDGYEVGKLTIGGCIQGTPDQIFGYELREGGSGGGNYVYGAIIPEALTWLDQDTEDFERENIEPWICDPNVGGNFWKYSTDNTTLPNADAGIDEDECNTCVNGWYVIEGYSKDDPGLNNAYWIEIDLSDPLLTYAELQFYMDYELEDENIYIEFSPDWEPGTDMDEATWTIYWGRTPGSDPFDGDTEGWQHISEFVDDDRFNLDEYLGRVVYLRFRMTTVGNGAPVGEGWAIDGLALTVKRGDTPVLEDNEPPVTSIFFNQQTGEVTLVAVDYPLNKGSGVAETKYSLDGTEYTYNGPFNIGEGETQVGYWSIDNAGNEEGKNFVTYVVDTTEPTVELTSPEAGIYFLGNKVLSFGSKAICIGKVPIAADADDGEGSGIARVLFDVNGDTGYDSTAPYEYVFRGMNFGALEISATAIDNKGLMSDPAEMSVTCFSLGLL